MKRHMGSILPKLRDWYRTQILGTEAVIVATAMLRKFDGPFRLILFQRGTLNRWDFWQFHFTRPIFLIHVFAVPGGWRMVYVTGTQLSTAASEDGLTWTADGILPLSGADPTVLERDGSWWLYIKGKARTNGGADGGG